MTAMGFFEHEITRCCTGSLRATHCGSSEKLSQASTLVIRALALVNYTRDWWRVMRREVFSGLGVGDPGFDWVAYRRRVSVSVCRTTQVTLAIDSNEFWI